MHAEFSGLRFFVTESGRIGLGDGLIEKGDKVMLFSGGDRPYKCEVPIKRID